MSRKKRMTIGLKAVILGIVIFYLCFMSLPTETVLFYLALIASVVFSVFVGVYFYSSQMALIEAVEMVDAFLLGKKISLWMKKHVTKRLIKDVYQGSVDNLIFALDGNKKISRKEKEELLEYLEKL